MAKTAAPTSPRTPRKPAPKRSRATQGRRPPRGSPPITPAKAGDRFRTTVRDATKVSEEMLKSVEDGQRAALEAVQSFVETVDRALPPRGDGPSRRQEVIDSALEMADRLVHTQYDFLRNVVRSAGRSLSETNRIEVR